MADQRDDFAFLHFQRSVGQHKPGGRVRIAETDLVELNGVLELSEFDRMRFFTNRLDAIKILEDLLGCAERLLEDVVNAGEAFHGLIQHQQGEYETGELPGSERTVFDLRARVSEQGDDGDGGKKLDDRRGQRLLGDIVQVAVFQATRSEAETVGFQVLGAEGLDYLLSADSLLQNLVEFGGVVLRAAGNAPDAASNSRCRHQHERQHGETGERRAPVFLENNEQQEDGRE